MTTTVLHGDCLDLMPTLDADSFDAIVTDPPYALPGGFMGKAWDNFDGREDTGFGYWLAGFTDGEGCFRVQRHERGTHNCGFTIKVRRDDAAVIERIRRFVGHGTIAEAEGEGGSKPQVRYAVQDLAGCLALVGLFRRFPLTAKKALDFEVWAEAVGEWAGRPRGNRWHGPSDQAHAAALKARLENVRHYVDVPWSGNRFQDWVRLWALEAMRVMKPGAHLVAFGGARTSHRLTAGLEDAGFEIRDTLMFMFGSGFPKSHNGPWGGTALKPAWEPIILARKPLVGTVAANVAAHGTGGLNIDGCRLAAGAEVIEREEVFESTTVAHDGYTRPGASKFTHKPTQRSGPANASGRWPANVVLDEVAAAALDEQSGTLTSGVPGIMRLGENRGAALGAESRAAGTPMTGFGDSGGASRFFYTAKAGRSERDAGLTGERKPLHWSSGAQNPGAFQSPNTDRSARNHHPTVKPLDLMRWLCRLVTPPGGRILDPFAGSGSTGCAAELEGFSSVLIEREAEYVEIIRARVAHYAELHQPTLFGGVA